MTTTQGDAAGSAIPVSSALGALTTATGGGLGTPERVLVLCSAAADVKVPPSPWQPSATGGAGRDRHRGQVQLVEAWTHCSNSSFKDEMTGLVSTDPGRDFMLGRPQAGWTPSLSSTISY